MDFAPLFKAQDYNATEWADLFVKSGARYAVLTTKHHDGLPYGIAKKHLSTIDDHGIVWK